MAKITWQFIGPKPDGTPGTYDFTSLVYSMNMFQGRRSYLDNYGSSGMTVTINNNTGYATRLVYGQAVAIYGALSGTNYIISTGYVSGVTFDDFNNGAGISTATVSMTDVLSYTGRVYANSWVVAQNTGSYQAELLEYSAGGPLPSTITVTGYNPGTGSILQGQTYIGSVLNYLNASITTERGILAAQGSMIIYVPRSYVATYPDSAYNVTLKPTTGSSQLMYQQIERRNAGAEFINTQTTQPNGLAAQTSINTTSVAAYGPSTGSSFTYDYNTTQAADNGSWIVNTFGDPNSQRIDVSFDDVSQDAAGLLYFLSKWNVAVRTFNLTYTPPGGSVTTQQMVMEGVTFNVTPTKTDVTLNLSPLTYYQFFTLDSSTLGILDTSRLGW